MIVATHAQAHTQTHTHTYIYIYYTPPKKSQTLQNLYPYATKPENAFDLIGWSGSYAISKDEQRLKPVIIQTSNI